MNNLKHNCLNDIENIVTGNEIEKQDQLAENSSSTATEESEEQIIAPSSNALNTTECNETSALQKNDLNGLDAFVTKALEKIKENFFNNEIDEQKLAEFMFKMLSLNITHFNPNDIKLNTDLLDNLMEEIVGNNEIASGPDQVSLVIDKIFGLDASETITEKLCNEKVDDLIEKIFGEDTKKLMCEKLQTENLEELFDKLIDEKFKLDEHPDAQHPDFDNFIKQILGKDSEEFIRHKLETFISENTSDDDPKILELD